MNDLKVVLKKKNIPMLVDFCVEESLEFTVKPQAFPDTDWEFTMKIADIKTAVIAGMFLRDNRIEITGIDQQKYKKSTVKKNKEEDTNDKSSGINTAEEKQNNQDTAAMF